MDRELVMPHARFVRNLAFHLVRDEDEAHEIAQETLVTALETPSGAVHSMRSWLRTVALNRLRMRLRGARRRSALDEKTARAESIAPSEQTADREKLIRCAVDAVFGLKEPYRTTVVLRFYEGLTPGEIASRLEVPVETVRTRLKRALQRLRMTLDEEYGVRERWVVTLLPLSGWNEIPLGAGAEGVAIGAKGGFGVGSRVFLAIASTTVVAWVWVGLSQTEQTNPPGAEPGTPSGMRAKDTVPFGFDVASRGNDGSRPSPRPEYGVETILRQDAEAKRTASVRVHVSWSDGTVAAGVRAGLFPSVDGRAPSRPPGQLLNRMTGPDGSFFEDGLALGEWTLFLDRAALSHPVHLEQVGVSSLHVQLPQGVDVFGEVVDEQGVPVAFAEIVLASESRALDAGVVVAKSAQDGSFRVRDLSLARFVGARDEDRAPSWMIAVSGAAVDDQDLVLVLPGLGAEIGGHVIEPNGAPVPGATIVIECASALKKGSLPDGSFAMLPAPRFSVSDGSGRFSVKGLQAGELDLYVRSGNDRLSSFRERLSVAEGQSVERRVVLEKAVRLEGKVLGADGLPADNAEVVVHDSAVGDLREPLRTLTGPNGVYRIDGIAHGSFWVDVFGENTTGFATDELDGEGGTTVRWDAELSRGEEIRGILRSADGGVVPGAMIRVLASHDAVRGCDDRLRIFYEESQAETDENGRFAFAHRLVAPHRLSVFEPALSEGFPVMTLSAVMPGIADLELTIPAGTSCSASIRGRLLDFSGRPTDPFRVGVRRVNRSFGDDAIRWFLSKESGSFAVGPFPPGTYDLLVELFNGAEGKGGGPFCLDRVSLMPNADLDLGAIELPLAGELIGKLIWNGKERFDRPYLRVFDEERSIIRGGRFDHGRVRVGPLHPGRYYLCLVGIGRISIGTTAVPFEVLSGRTTEVDVPLHPGKVCRLRFDEPDGRAVTRSLKVEIFREDGTFLWQFICGRAVSGKLKCRLDLLPGVYCVEAVGDTGLSVSGEIEIDEDFSNAEPFVLTLRSS